MIDLKTKANRFIIMVLGVICLLFLGYIIYLLNRTEPSDDLAVATAIKEAKYYKDANGRLVAKIQQQQLSENNMKKAVDSLAKALKVKPKYIQGQHTITTEIDTQFVEKTIPVPYGKDTAYKVIKKDDWVDIEAVAGKDTGSIKLSIRDTISVTEVVKNPLIGRTTREILIRNANPYNITKSGYSYRIREKKTVISIGPYLGIDFRGKPSVGIAAQFPIINIKR